MDTKNSNLAKPITIVGLFWEFFANNKYAFFTYLLFLSMMPIRDVLIPHLIGNIVKAIEKKTSLTTPITMMFVATIFTNVVYNFIEYTEVELTPRFFAFVRQKVLELIFTENENDFHEVETGKIMAHLLRLPKALFSVMNSWKYTFIPYIILSITAIAYFWWQNTVLGLSLAIVIIFVWVMMYVSVQQCYKYAYTSESSVNDMTEYVDDVLKNMSTVLLSNYKEKELEEIQKFEDVSRESTRQAMLCSLKYRYLTTPISIIYFIFFVWTCHKAMKKGLLEAGKFVALILIIFRIFNAIWGLTEYMNEMIVRWGMLKKTFQIFQEHRNIMTAQMDAKDTFLQSHFTYANLSPLPDKNGFRLVDIEFFYKTKYGRVNKVFESFNLDIPNGQKLAVMGTIGSGKSTILKLLLKQYTPSKGEIYYNGIPYKDYATERIRNMIGYIPQNAVLFNKTIYENITYGLPHISRDEVASLIQKMNLEDMFVKFPDGIDTKVGKYGSNLSGGQRQIVTILRVILKNPSIILMDEPTASIDKKTKTVMYDLLHKIMQGRTVIVVTHDTFLLKYVDRVIYMENGKTVKDESPNILHFP
jgi:ABC-type multidrug transport system fused ATPase/permease subunit